MRSSFSRELMVLDIGEPSVSGRFVYGRYAPDESSTEPDEIDSVDPLRYVELRIMSPGHNISPGDEPSVTVSECDFLNGDFSLVKIDGSRVSDAFVSAVSGSTLLLSTAGEVAGVSRKQIAASLDAATPANVTTSALGGAMNQLIQSSPQTYDEFKAADRASIIARLNSKIVGDLIAKMAESVMTPTAGSAAATADTVKQTQSSSIASGWIQDPPALSVGAFSPTDTTATVSPISIRGFLIEKYQIGVSGGAKFLTKRYVPAQRSIVYAEPAVKYGATYRFVVKVIADVRIPALDGNQMGVVTVSCASSGTICDVSCVETDFPPPPADFVVSLRDKAALLTWSMPVNKQRDIMKFQVYKRASLYEPFRLLVELDFSSSPVVSAETPERTIRSTDPQNHFSDVTFVSNDIYALASIDAHGMSSGYSAQLRLSVNGSNSRLTRLVPQGCPKAYPNLFYTSDPFPDVIFESGKSKMSVYFTPQCINVTTRSGKSQRIVTTSLEGFYSLQIVSVDALKAKSVKISVRDARA